MNVSARNVFNGTVTALVAGPVNAEVEITTTGGDKIVAVVTQQSVKSLGVAVGKPATALFKALWVTLLTGEQSLRFSTRNQLSGTIKSVTKGAINTAAGIELAGGTVVTAVVTNESADALGLKVGAKATALIKASHVIVGVPA